MKFLTMIMLYLSIQLSANAGLIFSVDDSSINENDTITVNLLAQDIPSFDEMSLFIEFDTSIFDYVLGSFSSVLDDASTEVTPESYGLNLYFLDFVSEFNTSDLGAFILASFQLTARDIGNTSIEIKEDAFNNYFYNGVTFDEYVVERTEQSFSITAAPVAQVPEPATWLLLLIALVFISQKQFSKAAK